jgi:autotransporter-associated beta strand protein
LASRSGTYVNDPEILSISGTNTLTGLITLTTGGTIYNFQAAAGSKLVLANTFAPYSSWTSGKPYYELGGEGEGEILGGLPNGYNLTGVTNSLYKDGTSTWTLWGTNTYIGATVVTNGTLVVNGVITGNGRMGNSPSGVIYKDVNVLPLGTLRGVGRITAPVTVDGNLAPGTAAAFGTLAISNSLTLQAGSTCAFRLSPTGAAASDQVVGLTSVTYGGTLNVTLLPGQLLGGEVFKLFGANAYSGNFAAINLPPMDPALSWDTTKLAVDGTLRVNGSVAPQTIDVTRAALTPDGNFQMSGSATVSAGTYRILATTNLMDPASWIQVGGGTFVAGVLSFTDLDSTNHPQRFYRVIAP